MQYFHFGVDFTAVFAIMALSIQFTHFNFGRWCNVELGSSGKIRFNSPVHC